MRWFPRQIVGEDRVVLGEMKVFNDLLHCAPVEAQRCARAKREVDVKVMSLAATKEVEKMLGFNRSVINEDADGIEAHFDNVVEITFDDFGIVSPVTEPVFEILMLVVRKPDAGGRHVVQPIGLPAFAVQPKVAVATLDVSRFGFWMPDIEIVGEAVNDLAVEDEFCNDGQAFLRPMRRRPGLLEGSLFTGIEDESPIVREQGFAIKTFNHLQADMQIGLRNVA